MNLEHHLTSQSHPVASDVNRVFEGSRLLQTGEENGPSLHERELGDSHAVLHHFSAEIHTGSELTEIKPNSKNNSLWTLGRKSFVLAGGALLLSLAVGSPAEISLPPSPLGPPPFETRQRHEQASLAAITATKGAETWSGDSRAGAQHETHVHALKTSGVFSVRISMQGRTPSEAEFSLCGAETDPTILPEVEDGRWSGSVPIYLSLCREGKSVRVIGEARIDIRGAATPVADLAVTYPAASKTYTATTAQAAGLTPDFTLSVKETVTLGPIT